MSHIVRNRRTLKPTLTHTHIQKQASCHQTGQQPRLLVAPAFLLNVPSYSAVASLSKIAVSPQNAYTCTVWFWLHVFSRRQVCIACFSCGQAQGGDGLGGSGVGVGGAGFSLLADTGPRLKSSVRASARGTHTQTQMHASTI